MKQRQVGIELWEEPERYFKDIIDVDKRLMPEDINGSSVFALVR